MNGDFKCSNLGMKLKLLCSRNLIAVARNLQINKLIQKNPQSFHQKNTVAILSLIVGIITTVFTDRIGSSTSGLLYGQGRSTIQLQKRLEGDLQQARFHKMNQRYGEALRFVDGALGQAPDFPEALFLKAQILWEGVQDSGAAKSCIQEVMQLVPTPDEPL